MNGELAQVIALIAYGNEFLSEPQGEPPELFPSNSTFKYVSDVSFTRRTCKSVLFRKREVIATDTQTWFAGLKAGEVKRLRLATLQLGQRLLKGIPEHVGVAFAGNGTWALQADSEKGKQLWRPRWSVKNDREPQHRIWSVEYQGISAYLARADFPRIDEAGKELHDALYAAKTFSEMDHPVSSARNEPRVEIHKSFGPVGTTDNSPAIHRRESRNLEPTQVPEGRPNTARKKKSVVPNGTRNFISLPYPAINHRAIFSRPFGAQADLSV